MEDLRALHQMAGRAVSLPVGGNLKIRELSLIVGYQHPALFPSSRSGVDVG